MHHIDGSLIPRGHPHLPCTYTQCAAPLVFAKVATSLDWPAHGLLFVVPSSGLLDPFSAVE